MTVSERNKLLKIRLGLSYGYHSVIYSLCFLTLYSQVAEFMTLPSLTKAVVDSVQLNLTSVVYHDNSVTFRYLFSFWEFFWTCIFGLSFTTCLNKQTFYRLFWEAPPRESWADKNISYSLAIDGVDRPFIILDDSFIDIDFSQGIRQNTKNSGKFLLYQPWSSD